VSKLLQSAGHTVVLTEANAGWSEAKYLSSGNLASKLSAARPDLVVFALGGNNQKMKAADYLADVGQLVRMAKNAGAAHVLYVGPATATEVVTSARHETSADILAANVPSMGVTWLDSRPLTLSGQRSDGVHFNDAAYTSWAKAITDKIVSTSRGVSTSTLWAAVGVSVAALAVAVAFRYRRAVALHS
jgi:lysophospholipase L1-like esterase